MLVAATTPATKLNEETLTYLNQGKCLFNVMCTINVHCMAVLAQLYTFA